MMQAHASTPMVSSRALPTGNRGSAFCGGVVNEARHAQDRDVLAESVHTAEGDAGKVARRRVSARARPPARMASL